MSKDPLPLTDEEKYELALQTEHELARLARTYTIMERNRAEFMQAGASGKLAKHRKVLELFRNEQNNILTDLAVASAGARAKEDKKLSLKLTDLLVQYDDFDNEIKKERNYTKEIEDQIQIVKRKTLDLQAQQITDDKYQQRVLTVSNLPRGKRMVISALQNISCNEKIKNNNNQDNLPSTDEAEDNILSSNNISELVVASDQDIENICSQVLDQLDKLVSTDEEEPKNRTENNIEYQASCSPLKDKTNIEELFSMDAVSENTKEFMEDVNLSPRGKNDDPEYLPMQEIQNINSDSDSTDNKNISTHPVADIKENVEMSSSRMRKRKAEASEWPRNKIKNLKGEQTVQTLENKLEIQIKKFCAICAQNVQLRSELHHLLNERYEFNKIWDKLINNLCVGKKFMIDLIEQATVAYDQREEWVSKLQILRTKAHNELVAHIQEMREQQRKSDNDVKLQEFFLIKGQKRIMKDLEEIQLKKRQKSKAIIQRDLEKYLNLLISIKEFTNQDYVPDIAKEFLYEEEDNFAKFQYVNDLNKQMEDLSDSLSKYHNAIDENKLIHESRRIQQENTLKELEKSKNVKTLAVSQKEAELKSVEQKLQVILNGIGNLFKLFRCDNDPLLKLLGDNETINYNNAILYLEILEKNIQEALVTVHFREKNAASKKKGMKIDQFIVCQDRCPDVLEPIERICDTNPCPLCIEHDLVSDVIDQLQFASTKEEIQEKLKSRLKIEGSQAALHNVSACHLPKSRQIIQKRYQ